MAWARSAHRDRIDALLRTDADRLDIDRVRRASVYAVIDFDDAESATHAGIDAEDSHGTTLLEFWLARLRDCFGELACVLDVFFGARVSRWRSSAAHTPKVIAWTARMGANRRGSSGGCSAG